MYWLEKRTVQEQGRSPRIIWKRYAACGRRELLERVRMGQKRPGHWRVVLESVRTVLPPSMEKAG